MSGEQAVPSPERIAEIRKAHDTGYDERFANLIVGDLLAALAAAESERDTAREERDATSEARAELQRSYESEVAELRSALAAVQQRIAELESPSFELIRAELASSRAKFPGNRHMAVALMEEVGELARGLLEDDAQNVKDEAVQVAVTAIRIFDEGDADFGPAVPEPAEHARDCLSVLRPVSSPPNPCTCSAAPVATADEEANR
jgi:hypothetical protein